MKAINEIKSKVADLSKIENSVDYLIESLNNPESNSFAWIENSPVCTKIIDLDFNLKYMSKAGVDKLKIEDISSYYGKPYPLSFYSDSFKISMKECMEKVLKTKETITQEAAVLDTKGHELWFESTLIPIIDNTNSINHLLIVSQDISKRKKIELEIKQSQKFHESLLKTTPDIIYVYDLIEQKNVYNNNGNLKIIGYSMEEIHAFGSNLLSTIMHPNDYKNYIKNIVPLYENLKDGEIIELEYRAQHKNGSWRWLHSRESVFKRENGKTLQVIGVTGDITHRKKVELDLKQSKEKLKEALEITHLGTFIFDDSTDFFSTSSIGDKILGIDKSYKRDIQGWINLVHPEDLQEVQGLLDDSNSNYVALDFRIIRPKDKKITWISGYAKKEFNKEGVRTKITGTFQDVSDRKLAEQKLKATQEQLKNTFNLSPSIIALADLNKGCFLDANAAVTRILGYTIEEFTSVPYMEFIHPDDKPKTTTFIEEKLKGNNVASFKNRCRCKYGSYKWMAWQVTERDTTGIVTTIGSDITETVLSKKSKLDELNRVISSSPSCLKIITSKGKLLDMNRRGLDILAVDELSDIKGKSIYDVIDDQHKEDFIAFNKKICDGESGTLEFIIHNTKGEKVWVETYARPYKISTGEVAHIAITNDITERVNNEKILKENQELLKITGEIAKVGGWELNLITKKLKWSSEVKRVLEVEKDYVPNLERDINFYHPDDQEMIKTHLYNAIETGKKYNFEARIITQKRNLKYVKVFVLSVFKNNQCVRLYGAIQDITDRKIIELELDEYRKELETENVLLKKEMSLSFNFEDMVYSSAKMSDVLTMVEQVAKTKANVLILGETGTGKELIAKAIHKISDRKNNSLISVNCSAIPAELIESELFGHEKGSFTGAINNRLGKFELADGGTIFLDEIGEMPLSLQPKLLRAIQEGEIEPIGSTKVKKLNVRIIAATNRDLKKEVKEKRFREDLFFRLNVFPINIPPLRQRIDDIPVLTEYFVNKYSKKYNKSIDYISDITMQELKYYNWPGNVRELENLIERAIIITNSNILVIPDFSGGVSTNASHNNGGHRITLEQVQRDHILKTLNDTNWKIDGKNGTAELLDIKPSTLRDRMKKFGIKRP